MRWITRRRGYGEAAQRAIARQAAFSSSSKPEPVLEIGTW